MPPSHKNTLSISLAESLLFLRSADISTHRSTTVANTPPSILRGLLILTLVKPTRISSIQVELVGESVTTWIEGPSTRYQAEMQDKNKLFSVTQTFFRAPRITTRRRALSLEPGLSYYTDEFDSINHNPPPLSSLTRDHRPAQQISPADLPRGRERGRARLSVNEYSTQREPQDLQSPSPLALGSPSPVLSEDEDLVPPLNSPVDDVHAHPTHTSLRSALRKRVPIITPPTSTMDTPYESRSFLHPPSISPSSSPSPRPTSYTPPVSHLHPPVNLNFHSLQHHDLSQAGRDHHISDDNSLERPRSHSRGRSMKARFSLASMSTSILEAVRSVRGASPERGQSKRGGESKDDIHSHPPPAPLGHMSELVGSDGSEQGLEESGDGWQEFKKGTYTFPISFAIPSQMPPTMQCDYGSVTWHLKANVHRPGAFTHKLSASREVVLVASPVEDDRGDNDGLMIERFWEDQMQYMVSVSGRVFPIGGTMPITLSFLPLAKIKIFKISVQLEEQVEYYYTFSSGTCRKDPKRRFNLLLLQSKDEDVALLPLPERVTSNTDSPLHTLVRSDSNSSEFLTHLMGPGPWTLHMALAVPSACGLLHFSNKNKRAPIEISHMLKLVFRVQRGDDQLMDSETGKRKQFDIVLRMPMYILSSLSNIQHTALPRYSESLDAPPSPPPPPGVPCAASQNGAQPPRHRHRHSFVLQRQGVFGPLAEEQSTEVDTLYERNVIFERLITGQQSEDGAVPPAYYAVS
ncbi:hypothetical protein BJV74DRAFT_986079 [Russula compacta]|nr:hypothetical protein BJV74DRAFT_986079 [Russula compacta]